MTDPNINHPAVVLYRQTFRLCPNWGFRKDIAVTVKDLDLWKSVITNWYYENNRKRIRFNPLNVKGMLSEYERRNGKTL